MRDGNEWKKQNGLTSEKKGTGGLRKKEGMKQFMEGILILINPLLKKSAISALPKLCPHHISCNL